MQIVVDNLLTHYERHGKGRTVVILPGWADQIASWVTLSSELSKNFDVIMPDLPGFGGTEMPTTAWDLSNYAEFISYFLQKLGLSTVYAYIGHSNGGAITIRGLSDGKLKAEKLILIASAGIREQVSKRLGLVKTITKTGKLLSSTLPDTFQKKLRHQLYRAVGSDMLAAEHMSATFKKIVADDIQDDAKQIKQPTLLLYGETDKTTPPAHGQRLQNLIKSSSLKIVPSAGHFVYQDQPAITLKIIEDFLT